MAKQKQRSEAFDVIVIGAGFGGLATALTLAEGGARVALLETLGYPGGCASTFERQGYSFESGATLFSGFDEGQLMDLWIRKHHLAVEHEILDPVVQLRLPKLSLDIPPHREALVARFCTLPGAPAENIRAFFAFQQKVSSSLWRLFDESELLPPIAFRGALKHLSYLPGTLSLLPWVGRSLGSVLSRFGLEDYEPLRLFIDATCQITVQASSKEAEALFALAALDYYFRGTGHVHGGIGVLARGLARAIETLGGTVSYFDRAKALERRPEGYRVHCRSGPLEARAVVANLLPQAVSALLSEPPKRLERWGKQVEKGWGAAMLYLALPPSMAGLGGPAFHLELIQDPDRPLIEGNHLFCSVSGASERGRTPSGGRTVTVSTHVPAAHLASLDRKSQGTYVASIQDHMKAGLAALAPEIWDCVETVWPASPRTFQRFTGRPHGFVGGIPRRRGLGNYSNVWPRPVAKDLYMVGDSVFPGQSTLATALGGQRLATHMLRRYGFN